MPTSKQILLASTANQEALLRRLDAILAHLQGKPPGAAPSFTDTPTIAE